MPETPSFSYPKSERLKSKKLIEATFATGQKFKAWPLVAKSLDTELGQDVPCQTLVSVSKRSFKRAVDRNRIKRLMRESWRNRRSVFEDGLPERVQFAVVLIFVGKDLPSQEHVDRAMDRLLSRMNDALHDPA